MQSYEQSHLVNLSQSRVKRKHSTITEKRIDVGGRQRMLPIHRIQEREMRLKFNLQVP